MNKIGIRAHDIGKLSAKVLSEHVKSYGFDGIQLVFKKAIDDDVDFADLSEIKSNFKDIEIMMLGAYFNPVHHDQEIVNAGIETFKDHLKIARELNASYVGSETGSLMGSPWGYVKENHGLAPLDQVIEVFKDLTQTAQQYQASIAIEGAYAHVAYSPRRIQQILKAIDSPNLKVTIDLFNFLYIGNYQDRMQIFDACFDLLKDDIVIFHLKDFIVKNNKLIQVGLGQGLMDYQSIIKRIVTETPNAYLIFEGVTKDDIASSYQYIKKLLEGK